MTGNPDLVTAHPSSTLRPHGTRPRNAGAIRSEKISMNSSGVVHELAHDQVGGTGRRHFTDSLHASFRGAGDHGAAGQELHQAQLAHQRGIGCGSVRRGVHTGVVAAHEGDDGPLVLVGEPFAIHVEPVDVVGRPGQLRLEPGDALFLGIGQAHGRHAPDLDVVDRSAHRCRACGQVGPGQSQHVGVESVGQHHTVGDLTGQVLGAGTLGTHPQWHRVRTPTELELVALPGRRPSCAQCLDRHAEFLEFRHGCRTDTDVPQGTVA